MDDLIQTPYGEVRAQGLEDLQASFDTRKILTAVDDLDRFCALWRRELRDDLLRVHAMAHTVINNAALSALPGTEDLTEAAFTAAECFRDCEQSLQSILSLLDQIAELSPE
jgi:hypothetical protein